ncbi:DUF5776 domain-containing protein [Lentilactobacillus sp. TOM.63]|uniref:DUF5776 domain-containing protein n=1 Tax=Lentilactobacillus sp. TOM.63 TaxID=3055077 RepID=UPI0025A296B3|nr:DUF5776 domain-containing protein [Lentilactobacillus sp. TOM.63]MDM7517657.1 DUF5776 domain-containing protein [Lentilactobacillus sp. TOM.63]
MGITTKREFKHVIRMVLLSATFLVLGTVGSQAVRAANNTDDTSVPAVYNGVNANQKQMNIGVDNQNFTSWISLDGINSNYVQATRDPAPKSILNLDSYKKNPDSLYEHILVKNNSDSPMNFNIAFGLPQFYQRDTSANATNPVVLFRGTNFVKPTDGSANGITAQYADSEMNYTDQADTASWGKSDWQGVRAIKLFGTLNKKGDYYELDVPLELTNPDTVDYDHPFDTDESATAKDIQLTTVNLATYAYYHTLLQFARGANANKMFGINGTNKYLVTYRTGSTYFHATDIQNLMPVIKRSDIVVNDFGQSYNQANDDFPYIYSGGKFYQNFTTLKDINGNGWIQTLEDNGYGVPYENGHFLSQYSWDYTGQAADDTPTNGNQWMNKDGIGGMNLQVIKVIDVHGIDDQDQLTLNQGTKWNPSNEVTIWNPEAMDQEKLPDGSKPSVTVASTRPLKSDGTLDTSKTGSFDVTYTYTHRYPNEGERTFKKTIHVNVQSNVPNNGGSGSSTTSTTNSNSGNNQVGNDNFNTSTTTSQPAVPNYAAKEGAAVYATKGVYMYKNANFKKIQRIAKYPKAKRVNRPMFVVLDYKRSANGALRYKVRDVNHGTKTAGKIGYITANHKFVVRVYYSTMPKNKKITVITKKGVNAYKNVNLTKKSKHLKKGARLTVKKIVKHNLTTRYQLSNGQYITGNKKLVIQGNY